MPTNEILQEAFRSDYNVSRETLSALLNYEMQLLNWNRRINLIAKSTESDIWTRHFRDCAQLIQYIPSKCRKILDIGTGAGFPGLVLAIMSKGQRPNLHYSLLDESAKRCAFLREIVRASGANASIINSKIEEFNNDGFDLIVSRAFAPLERLFHQAAPHLNGEGNLLLLKGEEAEKELESARKKWSFTYKSYKSETNPNGVILFISELQSA